MDIVRVGLLHQCSVCFDIGWYNTTLVQTNDFVTEVVAESFFLIREVLKYTKYTGSIPGRLLASV